MNVVMRALAKDYPQTNAGRIVTAHRGSSLVDLTASPLRVMPVVTLMFTVTGILLLIATVNVAGMLLARTVAAASSPCGCRWGPRAGGCCDS